MENKIVEEFTKKKFSQQRWDTEQEISNLSCHAHVTTTRYFTRTGRREIHNILIYFEGDSANAVPHYHKLRTRVTHIWGDRKGQPNRSAMERPHSGGTAFVITVALVPGKYALVVEALDYKGSA